MKRERRFEKGIELREEGGKREIRGYAARFNSNSQNLGGFVEKIEPGAFADAILTDDVRGLFNHDSNLILGRNTAGTMRLTEDANGLFYEIDPPDTQCGRDLMESIKRGDIDGSSFAFSAVDDSWGKMDDGTPLRTIRKAKLFDVSPVTYPAYRSTSVSVRSEMFPDGMPEVPAEIREAPPAVVAEPAVPVVEVPAIVAEPVVEQKKVLTMLERINRMAELAQDDGA